jgi:outer membrane protein TolC
MLATELQIGDLEITLAQLMGAESVDSTTFADGLPALAEPALTILEGTAETGKTPTAERRTDDLRVAEARAREELARKSAAATLSVALSLTPRYKDERDDPSDPATLLTDFQGDGAGVDATVTVGLAVPLTDGGANSRARARAEVQRNIAGSQLAATEERERRRSEYLRMRKDVLEERVRLLQEELELSEQRIRRERELIELNASTEVQVETLRLEAERIRNQLWQLQVERYLTVLDLLQLAGVDLREALAQ